MPTKKINTRGLTSFFTLFGFLIMSITGLMLYVVPAGRVAYWVDWHIWGLSKTQWGNIHILSSLLFIVAGAFHIYFNWKPLMHYFKDKISKKVRLGRELAIAGVLSVIIFLSGIYPIPPFSYLLDFNAFVKEAWVVKDEYEPPFGHAELMSLSAFSTKMDIDLDAAMRELRQLGIQFSDPSETLEDIARNNGISPMELYMKIKKFETPPVTDMSKEYTPEMVEVEFSGTGLGNRTLPALCEQFGIDLDTARSRLKAQDIEYTDDETLKKVAERYEVEPIELLKVVLVKGYTFK